MKLCRCGKSSSRSKQSQSRITVGAYACWPAATVKSWDAKSNLSLLHSQLQERSLSCSGDADSPRTSWLKAQPYLHFFLLSATLLVQSCRLRGLEEMYMIQSASIRWALASCGLAHYWPKILFQLSTIDASAAISAKHAQAISFPCMALPSARWLWLAILEWVDDMYIK